MPGTDYSKRIRQNKLTTLLSSNATEGLTSLHEMFVTKTAKLKVTPTDLDQLSDHLSMLSQIQADTATIESQFAPIQGMFEILEKYEYPIKDSERQQLETLQPTWAAFQQTLVDVDKTIQDCKVKFKTELLVSVDELSRSASNIKDEFTSKGPFAASFGVERASKMIADYRNMIQNAATTERNLKKGLAVFGLEQAPSKDIEAVAGELELLNSVWVLTEEWNTAYDIWRSRSFLSLDATEMEETVAKFLKKISKFSIELIKKSV